MDKMPLVLFVFYSVFTMNLVLQCGLGIRGIAAVGNPDRILTLVKLSIVFAAVVLLWVIFSRVISSITGGLFVYVLIFPVSYIVYNGLEFLVFTYLYKKERNGRCSIGFLGGITAACAFVCVNIASGFLEALALSFGFALGTVIVFLILCEIRSRAALEAVPRFLRGKPLILVSMGLLSLVFSVSSLLLFRIIGS
ncbi:MAG: hypothetical protein LBH16_00865 [Treponema sp.]|jgi:electron transport complex protein RnfA|nr:hypothetical protein [Treponema sp.]